MPMPKDILKLVPDQSEVVKNLAEQYRKCAKASSENILGLSETVYIANRELNLRYLEDFYREVGLDPKGATARKLKEIGEKLTRFQPYLDKLPNTWTTIYVLAKMQDHDFQRVVDSGVLHPFATLKAIEDAVRVKKVGDEEHTFRVFVDLNKLGGVSKQKEFARKLKNLLDEYHVAFETSTGHKSDLDALLEEGEQVRTDVAA